VGGNYTFTRQTVLLQLSFVQNRKLRTLFTDFNFCHISAFNLDPSHFSPLKDYLMTRPTVCFALITAAFISTGFGAEPAHDAIKPVPRSGGWMKRHESFNARVAKGKVDLVFIGDSITQGWEGRGKKVWAKSYGKRNTVNLGIGGDRTQHVIWRLDNGNVKDIAPKAAVIMIGTNNSGSNSPKQIAEGVTKIVDQLKEKTPKTKILLLAVFPRGTNNDDKRRKVNEGANAIFAKLADGKHVHYLDIGPKFLEKDGTLTREIMPDLLHLSEKGYQIWADSIEAKVAELLGEK
jgi:lysophospholipase L1-like esterase